MSYLNQIEYTVLYEYYMGNKFNLGEIWNKVHDAHFLIEYNVPDCDNVINKFVDKGLIHVFGDVAADRTKYEITDKGKRLYEYELKERELQKKRDDLQDQLLESSISNNKKSPWFAGLAAIFACLSLVVSIFTYFKDDEKLSPQLQQLKTAMQSQRPELEKTASFLEKMNHSIQNVADSLSSHK